MGDLLGQTRLLLEEVLVRQQGGAHSGSVWVLMPQYSDGDTIMSKTLSFGWDVKLRSWLSLIKSRGVTRCPGQIPSTGPCQSWPPNNPHPLYWLYDSLSSPPVAGDRTGALSVAAVASSRWMLHTGGGWGEIPHMIVKRFGCTIKHYKCIIHSIIHLWFVGEQFLLSFFI